MGRHEEALREAETARALDPLSPIIQTWLGLRYYMAGKPDAAIAEFRKALELDPEFAPAHWHLGWAYEQVAASRRASRRPNGRWPWTGETCSIWPLSLMPK